MARSPARSRAPGQPARAQETSCASARSASSHRSDGSAWPPRDTAGAVRPARRHRVRAAARACARCCGSRRRSPLSARAPAPRSAAAPSARPSRSVFPAQAQAFTTSPRDGTAAAVAAQLASMSARRPVKSSIWACRRAQRARQSFGVRSGRGDDGSGPEISSGADSAPGGSRRSGVDRGLRGVRAQARRSTRVQTSATSAGTGGTAVEATRPRQTRAGGGLAGAEAQDSRTDASGTGGNPFQPRFGVDMESTFDILHCNINA